MWELELHQNGQKWLPNRWSTSGEVSFPNHKGNSRWEAVLSGLEARTTSGQPHWLCSTPRVTQGGKAVWGQRPTRRRTAHSGSQVDVAQSSNSNLIGRLWGLGKNTFFNSSPNRSHVQLGSRITALKYLPSAPKTCSVLHLPPAD